MIDKLMLNIIKLVDLIAEKEHSGRYLTNRDRLIELNALVMAHSIVTGTEYMKYDQTGPEPAKDYPCGN